VLLIGVGQVLVETVTRRTTALIPIRIGAICRRPTSSTPPRKTMPVMVAEAIEPT
jgi:hypothetical protein